MTTTDDKRESIESITNGAALASFVAAGIGAFAVGFLVILNEAGLFAAPALYGPAGGVSGRMTIASVIWVISWAVLHGRWKDRQIEPSRGYATALLLIAVGLVLSFPPVWKLFG